MTICPFSPNETDKRHVHRTTLPPPIPTISIAIAIVIVMTGKQLTVFQREILGKLFQLQKLTNRDIAGVLDVDERTIRRRRDEFNATGELRAHKDVSKNAEKFKPEAVAVCDAC